MDNATITIKAFDDWGNVIETYAVITKIYPELVLLEFLTNIRSNYPNVTRVDMTIQY